jgi:hypothetical protein
MIGEWMGYAGIIGTCAACLAAAVDPWLRARRLPVRWAWMAVFGTSVLVPFAVGMRPQPGLVGAPGPAGDPLESHGLVVPSPAFSGDRVLAVAWAGGSLFVTGALLLGLVELARARRRAVRETWEGRAVGVTRDFGPGAAPFGEPSILVPRWVGQLTPEARRLLLTHEEEHVRANDARLLLGAALVVAAMPWNVALWWSLRRLRTAIELDCDARVLRREPAVGPYARLLLDVAGRARAPATPALLSFADSTAQLRTRIDTMTVNRPLETRVRVATAALAMVALVVACEARRPAPVAPVTDFVFQDGQALPSSVRGDVPDSASANALPFKVPSTALAGDPAQPLVIVRSADGTERFTGRLARGATDPLGLLPPDQISSIEVIKRPEALPPAAKGGLIVITLKPGATWQPEKETIGPVRRP